MDYEEAMVTTVSQAEAIAEIMLHGADIAEFYKDFGRCKEYAGADVLRWLGY
jgi:hypothetical protein